MQLGVGLNLKQRQNTDGFSCKLHLLTLELINTLYHNTWYHNLEEKLEEKHWIKTWKKKPYNNLNTSYDFTFKYLYIIIKSHNSPIKWD